MLVPGPHGNHSPRLRLPYADLLDTLTRALSKAGFDSRRACRCAQLFAESSRDGVYSHGVNRFPLFVSMIKTGVIDVHAAPQLVSESGPMERWDGKAGPGNLNADLCMERAINIARQYGIGCVALRNTNHWMRGGTYGWQAAEAGVIGVCWTNTCPNLPPWGATDPRVGNNPLVVAVPRRDGHVVLDTAMSQFSYGALASYRLRNELLPVEGGFDKGGKLTRVPGDIEISKRPLPIGYWKGSGIALMLDLVAGLLSAGSTTYQIPAEAERETRLSQVFIAFDPSRCGDSIDTSDLAEQVIRHFRFPTHGEGARVRYPGERVLDTRKDNLANGVPVEPSAWRQVLDLAA